MTKIMMLTPNFENNSLGRTWCLWMLARHLGWDVSIHGVKGHKIWAPLQGSGMEADCDVPAPGESRDAVVDRLESVARQADLIVAVKPLVPSYGVALELEKRTGTPVLLDVDDPDIEVRTSWKPWWERLARLALKSDYRAISALKRSVPKAAGTTVSNPVLQSWYGGLVVPHVRPAVAERAVSTGSAPVVRFVGSVRGHKGVAGLREAVARVAHRGVRLEVTDAAPEDAKAWETWLGTTDIATGQELVATADIIAVPSEDRSWSRAQLPAKLLDAMAAGRAVVATDLAPIRWATGDSALLVQPGSVDQLTAALEQLCDEQRREQLGCAALEQATQRFTPQVLAPAWGRLCESIIRGHQGEPTP